MISIEKNELRGLIRESYIRSINEGRDHDREIAAAILSTKDLLVSRNFVCTTRYNAPNANKRHRDFGYCNLKIDTRMGRGKSMTPRRIASFVSKICEKTGINKYFSITEHGYDGRYCDCGLTLKPKYVQKYLNSQQTQ